MNGAESLVKTLLASGVDTVFANPGTSEMHFVGALDSHPEMRCILCLFEGGTSGAADSYFRMKRDVSATLLHLAPGFGNAFANMHNGRKAGSGIVNIVGEHATHHLAYESPLKGDLDGMVATVSQWSRRSTDAPSVARDGAETVRAARALNGQIATLVLPADTAWTPAETHVTAAAPAPLHRPEPERIDAAARRLSQLGAVLMLGRHALFGEDLELAARIAAKTGARLFSDTAISRLSLGAGAPRITQLPYAVPQKAAALEGASSITLVGLHRPVTFFAYPGTSSLPEPADCEIDDLCRPEMDISWTLRALADATGAQSTAPAVNDMPPPAVPTGPATGEKTGLALAALLPDNAIFLNEAVSNGRNYASALRAARPIDVLGSTGGSIGWCLPGAVGAATACPDRKVVAVTGDGSAMYTMQSLWTMAREGLDVTVVVLANRGYQILRGEMTNVGIRGYGANASAMLDVENPTLDFVALARGHGVPATRAEDMETFARALTDGIAAEGPSLIELVCP
ncbi:acetolactate synthase large subunit [Psychromarinibacter sp. C21-152]|uniref:Acetolactate synthase large subunit n=1 Tax=Psychromarinibacter sediminicola TaxID=3033385 RepID=A0AAE3NPE7_9RHOB|nr:acetolactate synthase large subunit [Psychromarinibacter sediminicola]MDF0599577.1 acetolactate synthase large subunit [Psychromarinibacter sediminicola]